MEQRTLGKSGISIAPLVFGGNVFGWTADENTSFHLLDHFTGAGFNFIDTADVYARWVPGNKGGESETVIGKWLKQSGKRNQVIIATKVGKGAPDGKTLLSRKYILQTVEESLQRLQTDYIDVYFSHDDDTVTPLEETLGAYDELIKAGKVRSIGASNYSAARLQQALNISAANNLPRYETLQPLYNLYEREVFEKDLEAVCLKEQVGVVSFFSLASGFLTGKYRSEADLGKSARGGGIKKYLNARGLGILEALDEVAADYRETPTQVALAWLMARKSVTAPIASATSVTQLEDLVKAASLKLSDAAIETLNQASAWQ
ncbi:aldo/keto reductase [Deminuibacter soli]|uniref:Aldo/keto reductase n=1 Tax=Deminuibacter soli TaxID=2291815 RepID=A0A3E1NEM8_9BACT|nr:aldo/keto reductase [Deminuibacter soli]RFM26312.1 aldo/keto reductase [Deminuibacter soli]